MKPKESRGHQSPKLFSTNRFAFGFGCAGDAAYNCMQAGRFQKISLRIRPHVRLGLRLGLIMRVSARIDFHRFIRPDEHLVVLETS
jgi:hypothetical protein